MAVSMPNSTKGWKKRRHARSRSGAGPGAISRRDSSRQILASAFAEHQAGNLARAESLYRQILEMSPDDPDANYLLGMLADQVGDKKAAILLIKKSISVRPDVAEVHRNLGVILAECALLDEALASLEHARELDTGDAETHIALGGVYEKTGERARAIACFEAAVSLEPRNALAHNNLGVIYDRSGDEPEAERRYKTAIVNNPDLAEPYNNLGTLLSNEGKLDEAISLFRRALEINPHYLSALNNLAAALFRNRDLSGSIAASRTALRQDPDSSATTARLYEALQLACEWQDIEEVCARLDRQTRLALQQGRRPDEPPLVNISRTADPAFNLAVARSWSTQLGQDLRATPFAPRPCADRSGEPRLTIGYLSSDLWEHPVAYLTQGLFSLHDRDRFRVHVYSAGKDDGSVYRQEAMRDSDQFVDIRREPLAVTARRIFEDRVDILVDLGGHTSASRMPVCAWRPSPIQAAWIGFTGSTGADFIDYVITDPVVTPEDQAPHYTERFAYLPDCYFMNGLRSDDSAAGAGMPVNRAAWGLPESGFVFCSFVTSHKIEPRLFDSWMRILRATDDSVLWLYRANEAVETNLRREAAARGVDPDRLRFGGKVDRDSHIARLRCADLALDSWTYGGHTTTSDALLADVPVLVLTGGHFASRVSTSILLAIGMGSMITRTVRDYEDLAIRLAQDRGLLAAAKAQVAANRERFPLFKTRQLVRNLEALYLQMWAQYCRGGDPT
jgi:protein O-GlcNAc transferase